MDGKRLKELRKQKKLTQKELGEIINVSKVSISGYESGDRTPDTDNLKRLADYFGVSSDYLLGREKEEGKLEYYKKKIVTEFPDIDLMFKDMESLTAKEMQEVYEYIKFKKSQKK
ncbi:helix-turn-helix transcriptional regulator [Virgibacillus salarius]|uniref:helix-turn-helix domain-containing protein n=1 Tax=Virgibacillus salarius TaxID=447199 RepID=UPI002491B0B4|nr:helix-turn-helix transcriptional regulator [Virgibacillus salarius]WBX81333.1 helix-turn-helix transcriptional regulator [Virgibacillus salarius]